MIYEGDSYVYRADCSLEWNIEGFTARAVVQDEILRTPEFDLDAATWFLKVCPNGHSDFDSEGWIDLCLMAKDAGDEDLTVSCCVGIKAKNGTTYKSATYVGDFSEDAIENSGVQLLERAEFLKEKDKLAPDDVVTFFCDIRLGAATKDAESQTPGIYNLNVDMMALFETLSGNLKDLLQSGEHSDVTIKVKNEEFAAHSQILAARSPVFVPLFKHDMREKETGIVDITDCDPAAFRMFLMFVYSSNLDGISAANVTDVYYVADKYQVKDLKTYCVNFMRNNMSVDTFCDVLSLAVVHSERELMNYCSNFFVKNAYKIALTVKWMAFVGDHPLESNELFVKTLRELK